MKGYGKELILDIHNCKIKKFSRTLLKKYFIDLCKLIDMDRQDLHFWDYKGYPEEYKSAPDHLKGISAVQFIKTSNITIHTLDALKRVYLNIFSCKDYDVETVKRFTIDRFGGEIISSTVLDRL